MKKDYINSCDSQKNLLKNDGIFDFNQEQRKTAMHENRFLKNEKTSENQRILKRNEE